MATAARKQETATIVTPFFKEITAKNWYEARVACQKELVKTKIAIGEIARLAEVSFQTVSRMKSGETVDPRGKTLINIYKVLGIRLIFE